LLPEPYPGRAYISARIGLALLSADLVPGPVAAAGMPP